MTLSIRFYGTAVKTTTKQVARAIRRGLDSCFTDAELENLTELDKLTDLLTDLAMSREADEDTKSDADVELLMALVSELEG